MLSDLADFRHELVVELVVCVPDKGSSHRREYTCGEGESNTRERSGNQAHAGHFESWLPLRPKSGYAAAGAPPGPPSDVRRRHEVVKHPDLLRLLVDRLDALDETPPVELFRRFCYSVLLNVCLFLYVPRAHAVVAGALNLLPESNVPHPQVMRLHVVLRINTLPRAP